MNKKFYWCLFIAVCFNINIKAQTTPLKSFSLKTELTDIPSDTSGTTLFYSVAIIANDSSDINQVTFKLKSIETDSLINSQTFNIPVADGIYQTGHFANGLIKDGKAIYIILGQIKAKTKLLLYSDIIDTKNLTYNDITTTE